jgi:hypothetical protein
MISVLLVRSLKQFLPKTAVAFPDNGRKQLFEYTDENTYKRSIAVLTLTSIASAGYFFGIAQTLQSFVAFNFSAISIWALAYSAKETAKSMSLLKDGKHIEIETINVLASKTYVLPIEKIKCVKGDEGFRVRFKNQSFLLDQEGKILDLNLFYAVLRNLEVESSQFVLESQINDKEGLVNQKEAAN